MPINNKVEFFDGHEVLTDDMAFNEAGRQQQENYRVGDYWTDGVLQDPNGLSNMTVSIDAITNTLFNVGLGTGYANGFRIAIDSRLAYDANGPSFTTNGTCTPRSTGSFGVPLTDYTSGKSNFIWAEYMQQTNTGRAAVSVTDGSVHYPWAMDGYRIYVSTTNPPGNNNGITNAVYLATIFGQGVGSPLSSSPINGLTDIGKLYSHIRPNLSVGTAIVRGSTANVGGTQREIQQGTVSTPDLRDGAVSASKLRTTDTFTMDGLCITGTPGLLMTNGPVNATLQGGCFGTFLAKDPTTGLMVNLGKAGTVGMHYRPPNLVWHSPTEVEVEMNTNGICETTILFNDGEIRTVAENVNGISNHRLFKTYTTAQYTSGTEQSGLHSSVGGLTYNNWLALYAVKSRIDASKFVISGDNTPPVQENITTLDTRYGPSAWKYLGTVRLGLNVGTYNNYRSTTETAVVNFRHQGTKMTFRPFESTVLGGVRKMVDGLVFLGGVTNPDVYTTLYTYSSGMSGTSIPPNIATTYLRLHFTGTTTGGAVATSDFKTINVYSTLNPFAASSQRGNALAQDTIIAANASDPASQAAILQSYAIQTENSVLTPGFMRFRSTFRGPAVGETGVGIELDSWPIRDGVLISKADGAWPSNHSIYTGVGLVGFDDQALVETFGGPGL